MKTSLSFFKKIFQFNNFSNNSSVFSSRPFVTFISISWIFLCPNIFPYIWPNHHAMTCKQAGLIYPRFFSFAISDEKKIEFSFLVNFGFFRIFIIPLPYLPKLNI